MNRSYRFLAILLVLSALLFFLDERDTFSAAAGFIGRGVFSPITQTGSALTRKTSGALESVFLFRELLSDYRRLNEERDFYRGEYFRLYGVGEENEFLRSALNLENKKESELILAEVVAFNPLQPTHEITLDKGRRDGVKEGLAVIMPSRVLVGLISSVEENVSRATLITSDASRVTASIGEGGPTAIVTGSATGALRLELVPKDIELREGEIILSAGIGGDMLPNLLLGEVRRVNREESASFQEAILEPFFSRKDLRQLFIVNVNQ